MLRQSGFMYLSICFLKRPNPLRLGVPPYPGLGSDLEGVPHPRSGWGYPRPDLGQGYPHPNQGQGYPPSWPGMGYHCPDLGWGYPCPDLGGGTLCFYLGWGYPQLERMGVPPSWDGWGNLSPPPIGNHGGTSPLRWCKLTHKLKLLPSPILRMRAVTITDHETYFLFYVGRSIKMMEWSKIFCVQSFLIDLQSLAREENYADIIYLSLGTHKDCFGNVFMALLMMIYGNYLGSALYNFVVTLYIFGLYILFLILKREVCNLIRRNTQVALSNLMMFNEIVMLFQK